MTLAANVAALPLPAVLSLVDRFLVAGWPELLGALAAVLAAHPRVRSATLTIHKPHAPIPGDHAGISLTATLARP
jgi:hypothetical protein